MKKILNDGNQIHNSISSSGSGTVIIYGSGSISKKITVSTVPVPQRWITVAVTSPRGWVALVGRPYRVRWWRCPGQSRAGQPPHHSHSCSPRSWNRGGPISTYTPKRPNSKLCSVTDPGCLYRIPDPIFSIPDSNFFPPRIPNPYQKN